MNLHGKKEIVVRINMETGETSMEAIGWNGQGCREATRPFEDALGIVKDRTMKPVAYNANLTDEAKHIKLDGSL